MLDFPPIRDFRTVLAGLKSGVRLRVPRIFSHLPPGSDLMDSQLLVLLFMFAGLLLVLAEFIVPSGGLIAICCLVCFALSGYHAYHAWYVSSPAYFYTYCVSLMLLIPATMYGGIQILTHTSLGHRVISKPPALAEVTPYLEEEARLNKLIGQRGVATNLMTPGGIVTVHGERLHAVSEGLMIEPNAAIEVIAVRGTRIVVRAVSASEIAAAQPEPGLAPPVEPEADPWA